MKIVINKWLPDDSTNISVEIHSDGSIVPINFSPEYDETIEALGGQSSERLRRFLFIADDPLRALMAENIIPVGKDISKYMFDCISHATAVMSKSFPKNDPYVKTLRGLIKKAIAANGKYPKDTILYHSIIQPFYNGLQPGRDTIFDSDHTPAQHQVFLTITHTLILAIMYDQSTREWLKIHDGSITNTLLRMCITDLFATNTKGASTSYSVLLETPERAWQIKHFFEFVKISGRVRPS